MKHSLLILVLLLSLLATAARAALPVISAEVAADKKVVSITLNPPRRSGLAFVEVIEPASGKCVQTIYAGPVVPGLIFNITKLNGIAPGAYKLRYRYGIDLVSAGKVEPAAELKTKWKNPTDISVSTRGIYVLDSGFSGLEDPANKPVEREWKPTKGPAVVGRFQIAQSGYLYLINPAGAQVFTIFADLTPEDQKLATALEAARLKYNVDNSAFIYRFKPDGQPDAAFGDHGRVPFPGNAYYLRSLIVADDGEVYAFTGGHYIQVYTPDVSKATRMIGGWDGDPLGPKCTPANGSFALGRDNHIYLPNGYGNMKLYDRTKADYAGVLGRVDLPNLVSADRAITADRVGNVYEFGNDKRLHKYADDGKALTLAYLSNPEDYKLATPTGPSTVGGLIWFTCRGPGYGPFWDSGGGGEVAIFWDDMQSKTMRLVGRWGMPGKSAEELEFLNPAAAAVTPDQRELWVSEDGMENREGPAGNARVRRFLIKETKSEEIDLTIPVWP